MTKREAINSRQGVAYSPAVRFGTRVFAAGVSGIDSRGNAAPDIRGQGRLCTENVKSVLGNAGTSLDDVLRMLVCLLDLDDRPVFNEVYREYFKGTGPPARSSVGASDLVGDRVVEEQEWAAGLLEQHEALEGAPKASLDESPAFEVNVAGKGSGMLVCCPGAACAPAMRQLAGGKEQFRNHSGQGSATRRKR